MASVAAFFISTLIGLIGITLVVLVHEFGHTIAGMLCGINVEYLQIGFGRELFRITVKGLCIKFCIIPVGGLCHFTGEDDMQYALLSGRKSFNSCEDGSVYSVSPLKRVITYLSGPVANVLFCIICYCILSMIPIHNYTASSKIVLTSSYPQLYTESETPASVSGVQTGDTVISVNGNEIRTFDELSNILKQCTDNNTEAVLLTDRGSYTLRNGVSGWGLLPFIEPVVSKVKRFSPEYEAGLRKNDIIISVNGVACSNMMDLIVAKKLTDSIILTVSRNGRIINLPVYCLSGGEYGFYLKLNNYVTKGSNVTDALITSLSMCINDTKACISGIFSAFSGSVSLFKGIIPASNRIGNMTIRGFSQSLNTGIRTVFSLLGVICISISVVNMLPIPCMDGGMTIVSLIEAVSGRQFSPRFHMVLQSVGLILVCIIVVLTNIL